MSKIYLYNTLSRKKEEFKPIVPGNVGLYTCGPTVYNFAHLGNLRTYIFEDILKRVLKYNGYKVKHVMNVTDVGHLTSDADEGEDKMEKGARREGKTANEIADYYFKAFVSDLKKLNIEEPDTWCWATKNIDAQIDLIKILEKKGYTYKTSDGIYFDTSKFENYNKLSHLNLEDLKEGARVEANKEKKNPTDFALWKFSPKNEQRQQEWNSPWGVGFPGWHIECSAMSMKFLGEKLDIHCGGIDHINVHHTNEIAQSEAATGKQFFNYWMHGAFLNIEGGKKMAKSADNFLTLQKALMDKKIDPLVFRFATLQTHYRKPMEYSEGSIKNAQKAFRHLQNQVNELGDEIGEVDKNFTEKFLKQINDDLNMPRALAVLAELLKSDLSNKNKKATVLDFDKVFGLRLNKQEKTSLPDEILEIVEKRKKARAEKNWEESDRLRNLLQKKGYIVEDRGSEMRVYE